MRVIALALVLALVVPAAHAQGGVLDVLFPPPPPPQDDCGSGGDVASDAVGAFVLENEVKCAGELVGTDEDAYKFRAHAGQWVQFTTDDDWEKYEMSVCPFGPERESRGCYQVGYQNIQDSFVASATADYGYALHHSGSGDERFRYNVSVRIAGETDDDPHDDCGTGGNGANAYVAATPIGPSVDCTGTLRGMDAWDIYRFDVRRGQNVSVHLDVAADVDHEICVYPAWDAGSQQCSVRPVGEDEELHFTNAGATGVWYVNVYRYSGDAEYGLDLQVTGEPANEPPRIGSFECPIGAVVGEEIVCTYHAIDDSDGVRYRIWWDDGNVTDDPETGWLAPAEVRTSMHAYERAGWNVVELRVEDSDGAFSWRGLQEIYVRAEDRPQDDCGAGVDAGEGPAGALLLGGSVYRCAAQLLGKDLSDLADWYAVDVAEGGTLVAQIDRSYWLSSLCLIDPQGEEVACGEEAMVEDPVPGRWHVRVDPYDYQDAAYELTVFSQVERTEHALSPGSLLLTDMGEPLPGIDGVDGTWVELPQPAGERGYRLMADNGHFYAAWFYDAAGTLIERQEGTSARQSWPWPEPIERVPEDAARVFVQFTSSEPFCFEAFA